MEKADEDLHMILDLARYRSVQGAGCAGVWATWAILRLPEPLRTQAALAWKDGKVPSELKKEPS